MTGEVDPSQMV